jgi:hypothetical protein
MHGAALAAKSMSTSVQKHGCRPHPALQIRYAKTF